MQPGGEKMMTKLIACSCAWLLMLTVSLSADAEDSSDKLDELEERVRTLEERLSAVGEEPSDGDTLRAYWDEGLFFGSKDGAFKLSIGGRVQVDCAWFDQDSDLIAQLEAAGSDEPNWQDAAELRRARLRMDGLLYKTVEFRVQYDFADSSLKDAYVGLKDLPFGSIRVGHFKEPFSLQRLTSSRHLTFMERGLTGAFEAERNTGVMLHNHVMDDRVTYALGVFRDADDFGSGSGDGKYNITGRVTGLPLYENNGSRFVHLGLGYSYRNPDDEVQFQQGPEANLAPDPLVDTGSFEADGVNILGAETALVYGPVSLQGEYVTAMVDSDTASDPGFFKYYVEASYFLTGEHRSYKASEGVFGRVKPNKNFLGGDVGLGAWQIAARYSHIDLEDGAITGGKLDTITAAVNWYLNPNTRVMLNYIYADASEKYDGDANILQMRFQVEF